MLYRTPDQMRAVLLALRMQTRVVFSSYPSPVTGEWSEVKASLTFMRGVQDFLQHDPPLDEDDFTQLAFYRDNRDARVIPSHAHLAHMVQNARHRRRRDILAETIREDETLIITGSRDETSDRIATAISATTVLRFAEIYSLPHPVSQAAHALWQKDLTTHVLNLLLAWENEAFPTTPSVAAPRLDTRRNGLLVHRIGPMNPQKQKLTMQTPPARRGIWVFPWPFFDMYYAWHRTQDNAPEELPRLRELRALRESDVYENFPHEEQEKVLAEMDELYKEQDARREQWWEVHGKKQARKRTFYHNGPVYSHYSPHENLGYGNWFYWESATEWARHMKSRLPQKTYDASSLELFIPQHATKRGQ